MSARAKKKGKKTPSAPSWKCAWCPQTEGQQHRGPDGPKTLCGKCYMRNRKRETGPHSDDWECDWCGIQKAPSRWKGPKGPGTLCAPCGYRHRSGASGPPAEDWRCDWCSETTGRRYWGPRGRETLCKPCGERFGRGKTGPPLATFECRWCKTTSTRKQFAGPTGEDELCDWCGVVYAKASAKIKARLVHVEQELDRLTSVPVFDVDAGTETRGPAPKRSSEAPASGLKALKAATDATAGALVQVKREKEALEDRLLCTICMEADAPRSVLFGPCNHYLACASCAAALQECPNCRATITTRTPIANSS